MKNYCERARKLLEDSRNNVNPFDAYKPQVPEGVFLKPGEAEFDEMEAAGLAELAKVGFVLIAGGLGERLGYSSIKVSLPVVLIEEDYSYLKYYAQYVLAAKAAALEHDPSLDAATFFVPFAIMVSDDTHDRTVALLEKNDYFGLNKHQIDIIKQENVPALIDNSAKLAVSKDTGALLTKPHGHGDIHNMLFDTGVAAKWRDLGKEWMMFIQDTNALALKTIPSILGVSRKHNLQMNSVCVPRRPGEAMGAICRLVKEDNSGDEIVINVEYNQLDALLKAKWNKDGDVANDQGFSHFPGNTNTLVFKIPEYVENLTKTGGVIPEFVNPKYANEERTVFKSPTRLECMMQDYPKLLSSADSKVGFTMYEPWFCFSPVKNNVNDALNCHKKGLPSFSAASGEFDYFNWTNKMLEIVGVKIERETETTEFAGLPIAFGPKILLEPTFALTLAQLRQRFPGNTNISKRSTLVLGGTAHKGVPENLTLDGTLKANEPVNFFSHFTTDFVTYEPISEGAEYLKIRGYQAKIEAREW